MLYSRNEITRIEYDYKNKTKYCHYEDGSCDTLEYHENIKGWVSWDASHDLEMYAKKLQRYENLTGNVENNWRANNDGSASISSSTLSAIGDSIAEMYGREYSENFMRNF